MLLEIKNLKTFRGMEGSGFNATLYIDGRKSGMVIDDGNGGCFSYQLPREDHQKIIDHAKTLPRVPFGKGMSGDFQPDDDFVINELVVKFEKDKRIKSLIKTNLVYTSTDGELYSIKLKGPYTKEDGIRIREKFKDVAVIHNEVTT